MKSQFSGILALLGLAALTVWSLTHRPPKIGYVETSVVLNQFVEAERAHARFQDAQKDWDKNLKALNDSLVASMERMKSSYDAATKPEKEAMRSELQRRNEGMQKYSNAVKKMSADKEKELMEPVVQKLNSFLDLWGKQHGYDMLLGTMTGGNILQADPRLNVTAVVLQALNEQYKMEVPSSSAAATSHPASKIPKPAPDSSKKAESVK